MRQDRREYWARTIVDQETSGLGVRGFCRERGVNVASFYQWRRRVRGEDGGSVRFAPVEITAVPTSEMPLEIIFTSGERLRIARGATPPLSSCVYVCLTPCDMRRSFDSPQALVRDRLEQWEGLAPRTVDP